MRSLAGMLAGVALALAAGAAPAQSNDAAARMLTDGIAKQFPEKFKAGATGRHRG